MFKDKIAIVTGASQGIGASIAKKLEEQGATVVDLSVPFCDVTNVEMCEKCVKDVFEKYGKIDILINNAGITRDMLLLKMKKDDFDVVINVNLGGVFNMTKAVIPYMMKARYGKIVNISSIIGVVGNAGQANYSASKAGIIGLTKSAAREMGARGINVNAVAPGYIQTAMTEGLPEEVKEDFNKRIALKRMGQPEDIAKAVAFLASDEADYITGQVLIVDGGLI